jgi:predicted RNase H-like HicB family nuclease
MSARSKNSSERLDRPFDKTILRRAREIANQYQIILHFEDGLYYGRGLELPTAMNHGRTPDECVRATRDILTTAVAYMIESRQTPPSPASENKRSEQINVRLTPEEKLLIEEAARAKGYRGVSDFVRSASLANAK